MKVILENEVTLFIINFIVANDDDEDNYLYDGWISMSSSGNKNKHCEKIFVSGSTESSKSHFDSLRKYSDEHFVKMKTFPFHWNFTRA